MENKILSIAEILKESMNSQRKNSNLYIRKDPDSSNAYFETETPDIHTDVGASLDNLKFVWDRHKSNQNLGEHLFSHYLTRRVYNDCFRVINGQKVGKTTVDIKTDAGNEGLLCAVDLKLFKPNIKDDDNEIQEVVVIVRQEKLENNRIRLISCYPTENKFYLTWYYRNLASRNRFGSNRPDRLDKIDIPETFKESIKVVKKQQEEVYSEIIDELVDNSIKNIPLFRKLLKAKIMPNW